MEIHNITNCTRCGGEHKEVEFKRLTNSIENSDGTLWTHWAPCPITGEPILMRYILEDYNTNA